MDSPPEHASYSSSPAHSSFPPRAVRDRTTVILIALALAAGVMASTAPLWAYAPVDPWMFWLSYAGGAGLLVAGIIGVRVPAGRPIARLVLVCAMLYFLAFGFYFSVEVIFTLGFVLDGYWLPVAGHFIVAFPDGRLRSRFELAVILFVYAQGTLYRVAALFASPQDLGCEACPRNLLLVRSDPDILSLIQGIDSVVALTVTIPLIVVVLAQRWRSSTNPERRVLSPVFAALGGMLVLGVARYAARTMYLQGLVSSEPATIVRAAQEASVLLLPIGLIVGQLRSVLARASVANLLLRIGQGRTVTELERDIAWALGDPSVRITADGTVNTPDDASVVDSTDGAVLTIRHDPAVRRYQPELLHAVVAAARVALDNERLQAEATLTKSVSPGLAEQLQREGRRIGDIDTITISVLMSDVRDYTTLAEAAELHQLALQLQRHRAAMNEAIAANGGVVMQFVGDAVFAVFGAPEPMEDHALMAVRAGVDMQIAQRSINAEWAADGLEPFRLGIGITSGQVAAALLGSSEHVEYSLVGDVVNLAQRLQGMSDGDGVIIDDATCAALDGAMVASPLPATTVKGRTSVVAAYRIDIPSTIGVTPATAS